MRQRRHPVRRFLLRAAAGVVLLTLLLVLPLRWLPPLTTSFILQTALRQSEPVEFEWVPRGQISRRAALAVLAAEDQKFLNHRGFDFDAIRRVWKRNGEGRSPRGGSTITQQVCKNLWLWPERSWLRKGMEAWLTVWVELLWPKERILEVYLNVAQFGPTTFGVEAAARRYWRKPASALNEPEAAVLAAVLPNPVLLKAHNPSQYVRRRQSWILQQARALADDLSVARWTG